MFVFVFVYVIVWVCCVCVGGSGGGGDGGWVGVVFVVPSAVSLRTAETEQFYQGKRMIGGIGNMLFSAYSQTSKWKRSKTFFGEPLKHVIILRGQILLSRTDDDLPAPRGFNTSLCVRSKRPRVCQHHAHM